MSCLALLQGGMIIFYQQYLEVKMKLIISPSMFDGIKLFTFGSISIIRIFPKLSFTKNVFVT
jgi:hypothetical protein